MHFSSQQVNAEIKAKIWPALRTVGFDKFNTRNGWKHKLDSISVVNFQSFNSYYAAGNKCTTFSFCINLGVYYPCVHDTPWSAKWPVRYRVRPADPPEYGCHARLHLEKTITQTECPSSSIWYVRPDGSNLGAVIDDVLSVINKVGVPWLDKFTDLSIALAEYQTPREIGREEYVCAHGTHKAAQEGSAVALALNNFEAAISLWRAVLNSEFYSRFPDTLEQARAVLAMIEDARAARVKGK